MTSREISAKSLMIYFQNMMHDGIHLASNSAPERSVDLVCVKDNALWHFEDLGQSCALTSCRAHALSSGQDHKCGYLDKATINVEQRQKAALRSGKLAITWTEANSFVQN